MIKNSYIGIVNYGSIWLEYPGEDEDGNTVDLNHYARIYEFDTDSEQYKKLKIGDKIELNGVEKNGVVVTVINGKFVIAFSVIKYPKTKKDDITEQTAPEFADKGMQKAYNAFVSM